MPLNAGTRLGVYEVLSLIGAGGMGEVYRARDTRLAREVAIKVLPADLVSDVNRRRRFVQEAQGAAPSPGTQSFPPRSRTVAGLHYGHCRNNHSADHKDDRRLLSHGSHRHRHVSELLGAVSTATGD